MKKIRLKRAFMKYKPDDEIEVKAKLADWLVKKGTAEYIREAKKEPKK